MEANGGVNSVLCNGVDDSFGPSVPSGCRGGFDFTLLFEQAILSIVPCVLLFPLSVARLIQLRRAGTVVARDAAHTAKLVTIGSYAALQLAVLVLWTSPDVVRTRLSIPTACISFITALILGILSHYEHTKSPRPSTLLGIFLSFTILFDVAICRTLWLKHQDVSLASVFTAGLGVKLLLCILEAAPKSSIGDAAHPLPPEALSGPYGRSFYWWLNPLFYNGFRRVLTLKDLFVLEKSMSSEVLSHKIGDAWTKTSKRGRCALIFALFSALKFELMAPAAARIVLIGFNMSQPFFIAATIDFVQAPPQQESANTGYGLIGGAAIIYLGIAISNGQFNYKLYRAITSIRGCLVAMVYNKTIELTSSEAKSSASLTLMSTDVDRIALTCEKIFDIWGGAIEIVVAIYLLERQIGWACIAPLLLALLCFIGNSTISKFMPSRLKGWMQGVQARVALTSSSIRHIRPIKMMGLGPETMQMLQDARIHEVQRSAHFRWFVAFMNVMGLIPQYLSSAFVFLIFLYATQFRSDGGLTAARAFTTLSILQLLTSPLATVLQAIPSVTAAIGCLDRIQDYLRLETQGKTAVFPDGEMRVEYSAWSDSPATPDLEIEPEKIVGLSVDESPPIVASFEDVTLKYKVDSAEVLKSVELEIHQGSLVMVVGPVGSGKSTLLKALAGDITPAQGSVKLKYREVAYCQQTPWLTNCTVRESITGNSSNIDEKWYHTVVASCALDEDISSFPGGDDWVIGSAGFSLSGGQKQRLALARAVFSRKPLLVLDDVLSALDSKTEHIVFNSLFAEHGLLRQSETTIILATNAVHHLAAADKVVVLSEDSTISCVGTENEINAIPKLRQSHEDETQPRPKIGSPLDSKSKDAPKARAKNMDATASKIEEARRRTELSDYTDYFRSMGWLRAIIFVLVSIVFAFCSRFSQVWLQWFTGGVIVDRGVFIGVYFVFTLATALLYLVSFWWIMIVIAPISSADLHWKLVSGVFRAPLSFFSDTDAGVIVNRFSQDMAFTNAQLPICTNQSVTTVFVCLAQIALICIGSGYLATLIPALLVVVWLLQKFYLRTSRQLRILDLEHKSPVYSFFTETIEGLATIRAFGWGHTFMKRFQGRLDDSQRPVYFLYLIQRWLNLVLDLIVAALAVLLVAFATQFRSTSSGPALGVAMLNILSFSQSLGQLIFFYTGLETSLGAISRIKEYTNLSPEDPPLKIQKQPIAQWPSRGEVRLKNVFAAYNPNDDPVLKDVSLDLPDGNMIGITGRTGSGKSSLVLALLGFLELRSGTIHIDDVDIATVPRETLRTRITTIPQDPFFPGKRSIRQNLTSSVRSLPDRDLIAALDEVGLLPHLIATLRPPSEADSGKADTEKTSQEESSLLLDADLSTLPLSPGQLQLFCLARAMLYDNKIVLLDEVTSAIDHATEQKLRAVLRSCFRGKTVILVTHKPEMIQECDVVVTFNAGMVVKVESKTV